MKNKKYKIIMCGCSESGYDLIRELIEYGFKFEYFVTITEDKAKELNVSGYFDFSELANKYNIPIYYAEKYNLKSISDYNFFYSNKFDLLVQGGWQRLFPIEILNSLRIGAIGVHGSSEFLPKGRGRSPINWSLIEGKQRFIMHYFIIKAGVDDGDVFHFEMFDINAWDTCKTLYYKNIIVTKKVLINFIPKLLKNEYTSYTQEGNPSYYPKRTPDDGKINWQNTVFEIYNFVRAITKPYPGAFCFVNNFKILIWKAQPFDSRIFYMNKTQGEVLEVFFNGDFIVNCNSGLLLITEYECEIAINKGFILS